MTIKLFFIIAAYSIPAMGQAQNSDAQTIKKISDEIMRNSAAYENLRFLSKKIGPRLSGSSNAQSAVAATAKMLQEEELILYICNLAWYPIG